MAFGRTHPLHEKNDHPNLDAHNQLPRLRDLHPLAGLRLQYQKAPKQLDKSMRGAQGQSVLIQLISHVRIKGGLSNFQ